MANKWPDFEAVIILDASGNQVTTFGGSGGTSGTDDAAFTVATDSFTPVGGIVTADSVDSGDGGAFAMLANRQQKITLYDSSGVEVTSFGGGTQYTEGDTDASITGSAMLMEVAADTLQPVQGTVAAGLLVNLGANNDVTVTGTVDLGATDNAVLDAIAASVAAADTDLTTIIGHLDGVETLLTTIAGDTTAIEAAVEGTLTIAGTVDLGAVDNGVLGAIAASVAAADTDLTTIIGHVDGLETALGTLLTTAAHDAAFGTAGTADAQVRSIQGIASMTPVQVSQATAANLNVTEASAAAIATAAQLLDDTVYVDDADWTDSTSKHLLVGGLYEAAPQTVTGGDVAPFSINVNGAMRVTTAGGALTIPNIDSYTHAAFNLTAANDQVLIASAANKQIWIYGIQFTLSATGSVSFQDEDNTAITGIMPFHEHSGMSIAPSGNFAMPLWKCATDKDFEVDLVTAEMDGSVQYAIVSV